MDVRPHRSCPAIRPDKRCVWSSKLEMYERHEYDALNVLSLAMNGHIEAVHIYDDHTRPILSHTYTSRPLSAGQLLPLFLAHAAPRPSLIHLPNTNPPTLVFHVAHGNLLLLATAATEVPPLLVLEFLHRLVDVLEDFLGAPLLAQRIESNYDVVAQLLNEMCDAGTVSNTEPNALRDLVEVEGWVGKLLSNINLPGKPLTPTLPTGMATAPSANANSALPWRRGSVRHTSNELYVDLVESLSVIIAPSGQPISAYANGTIAVTSKLSGVPDLVLNLSTPSGRHNIESLMDLTVFHPCVRLARWREKPGELSFIPPDGRFVLAGYEVNLLPFVDGKISKMAIANLRMPVTVDVKTSLGPSSADFEVRLLINKFAVENGMRGPPRNGGFGRGGVGQGTGPTGGPLLDDLCITIPLPPDVRNLAEIRPSKGETTYNPGDTALQWRISTKEAQMGGMTLRCTLVGPLTGNEDDAATGSGVHDLGTYDYDEDGYQTSPAPARGGRPSAGADTIDTIDTDTDALTAPAPAHGSAADGNRLLMPSAVTASFNIKGWLPSGLRVESLVIDPRRSRGLAEGIKPYKGVKYLTVSKEGVEIRC